MNFFFAWFQIINMDFAGLHVDVGKWNGSEGSYKINFTLLRFREQTV